MDWHHFVNLFIEQPSYSHILVIVVVAVTVLTSESDTRKLHSCIFLQRLSSSFILCLYATLECIFICNIRLRYSPHLRKKQSK